MGNFRSQRGEGRLAFLISLAIVGALAFAAFKIVPVRFDAYEFRELIREEARFASAPPLKDDRQIVERILQQARERDIPIDKRGLAVRRTPTEIVITAAYEQPIDLKVTTYVYRFRTEQRAPLF